MCLQGISTMNVLPVIVQVKTTFSITSFYSYSNQLEEEETRSELWKRHDAIKRQDLNQSFSCN